MQLGIIVNPFDLAEFDKAKAWGLSFVELDLNVGCDLQAFTQNLPAMKEKIKSTGVRVGAMGRWGAKIIAEDGTLDPGQYAEMTQILDLAAELSCSVFMTGVNYISHQSLYQNCANAIGFYQNLIAYAKPKGISIAVYNCDWENFVCTPDIWKLVVDHIPELGIKYDPSHTLNRGGDYLLEMRDWAHRFHHIHIKGGLYIGGQYVDNPPAGLDTVNWGAFISLLHAKGYKAGLSIEPHSEHWLGALGDKGIGYTVDYINTILLQKDNGGTQS